MAESSGGVWRGCTRLSTRREASTRADYDSGSDGLVVVDEDEVDDASPEVPLSSPATSCPNLGGGSLRVGVAKEPGTSGNVSKIRWAYAVWCTRTPDVVRQICRPMIWVSSSPSCRVILSKAARNDL